MRGRNLHVACLAVGCVAAVFASEGAAIAEESAPQVTAATDRAGAGGQRVPLGGAKPIAPPSTEPASSTRVDGEPAPLVSGVIVPTALVTPELGIAAGAFMALFFKTEPSEPGQRTSNVPFGALYSIRNQFVAGVLPELFFDNNRVQFIGDFRFQRFPSLFYGRGQVARDSDEEDFTLQSVQMHPEIRRNVFSSLFVGMRYDFDSTGIRDAKGPKLTSGQFRGDRGGVASGLGPTLVWDTRDDLLNPRSGNYHQMAAVFFGPGLGSDFSYVRAFLDLRHYIGTVPGQMLAFNGYLGVTAGAPPFYLLQLLGGSSQLRGYYEGRFRDNNMALLQAEYRMHLFWRIGSAVFFGAGQVAQRFDQLGDPMTLRPAGGAGIRIVVSEREGFSVRGDVGVSETGVFPYVLFKEAF